MLWGRIGDRGEEEVGAGVVRFEQSRLDGNAGENGVLDWLPQLGQNQLHRRSRIIPPNMSIQRVDIRWILPLRQRREDDRIVYGEEEFNEGDQSVGGEGEQGLDEEGSVDCLP